jgi:membrane protease YdiL (CAAX protease family)
VTEVFICKTNMFIKKGFFENSDIFTRIVLLLIVMSLSTLVFSSFWYIFTDADIENVNSLKVLQLLQSVGMFVIPPFILAWLWSRMPIKSLKLNVIPSATSIFLTFILLIVAIPGINLLSWFNQQIVLPDFLQGLEKWLISSEEEAALLTEKLISVDTVSGLAVNVLLIAVIPALGEELFFRGSLFNIFSNSKSKVLAVWITAVIFSAVHFQFYGFFPRLLLGALFGYLLVWSENLWLPIVAHFTNNFIAVIFYYLQYNDYDVPDLDKVGAGQTWWLGLLSLVFTGFCIVWLRIKLKRPSKSCIS